MTVALWLRMNAPDAVVGAVIGHAEVHLREATSARCGAATLLGAWREVPDRPSTRGSRRDAMGYAARVSTSAIERFQQEVARLRAWADAVPEARRVGEWECEYPAWGELYRAWGALLVASPTADWPPAVLDDALYAIARDNELEQLIADLGDRGAGPLLHVARASIDRGEADARWQCADALGRRCELTHAEPLLIRFAADGDEYVRRRALQSLARLASPRVEALALAFWVEDHASRPWTRMNALWALHRIGSPALERLLAEAEGDANEFLAGFAARIRRNELDTSE